jgi:signal transduction histidine kinase
MKINYQLRILSLVVIVYMLLAFSWWSVLLYTKNQDAFRAKAELLKIGMVAEGVIQSSEEFYQSKRYLNLKKQYRRQEWMILGETVVFVIILLVGMWLINRAYHREMQTSKQQRNFLLSITHELKSPIASIRLVLDTFTKRTLPKEKLDQLSRSGLQETERLHKLVNDLLLSARLESAYQVQTDKINLRELFQDVIYRLEPRYPQIEFHLEEDFPLTDLEGDRLGMTSVAFNLLENAAKYSEGPTPVIIRISREGKEVRLDVEDQGRGIPDKEKKRIFEKFYRVGNEDTRKTKGTGLGLYIVKEVVEAHHGTIKVLDNQPRGTLFSIRLPLQSAAAKPK